MQATHKQRRYLAALKSQHPAAYSYAAQGHGDPSGWSISTASEVIDRIGEYVAYNPGSQRAKIAEILRVCGMSIPKAIRAIEPCVGTKPLVWSRNANGSRIPLPRSEQISRMRQTVADVAAELRDKPIPPPPNGEGNGNPGDSAGSDPDWLKELKDAMGGDSSSSGGSDGSESGSGSGSGSGDESGDSDDSEGSDDSEESEDSEDSDSESEEPNPEREAKTFLAFVRKARTYWARRNADGITAEAIGMRPALNGAKMIRAGITANACAYAMSIHWPQDAKDEMGVQAYEPTSFRPEQVSMLSETIGEAVHSVLPYALALASAKVPVCLIGTHGTGKTEIARQMARALSLPFGFASMTEGTPPSTFYGRVFPEHVQSVFENCYANGGVFLFDEMDAAHPNLLLIVNAALANGKFSNTATGTVLEMHRDFIPVCAMNTTGMGADRNYVGRKRLDAAALDRWHMGRIQVPIDENLESALYAEILRDSSDEMSEDSEAIPA